MPVDFSQLNAPTPESGTSKGLTFFSNALDAVLQRRQQMDQQRAQQAQAEAHFQQNMKFQQDQARMQEAARQRDDEQARRNAEAAAEQNRAKMELERQDRQGAAIKDVTGMVAGGQKSAVPAFLQAKGMTYAPKQIENPELAQPVRQPEHLIDYDQGSDEWEAQTRAEADAIDQELARQKVVNPQLAAVRGISTIGFPGGATHDIDEHGLSPEGLRERFANVPYSDPADAVAAKRITAAAVARGLKADQIGPLIEADRKQRLDHKNRLEVAEISARAAATKRDTPSAVDLTREMNTEWGTYLNQNNYKDTEKASQQFAGMANVAKAADKSSLAAQMFMGLYTKYAQGQVGVLTPGDISVFWSSAGTPLERGEEGLRKALSGSEGPEKREKAMVAINALADTLKARSEEMRQRGEILMEKYGADGDRVLRSYFGKGLPKFEKGRDEAEADAFLGGLPAVKGAK